MALVKRAIVLTIKGEISRSELDGVAQAIELKKNPRLTVFVESRGGDWDAAMQFGRFLRKARALVTVTEGGCYSACVLVLAGGVHRFINGPVGIHRPYSPDLSPKTYEEAQNQYRALEAATRRYLSEMNLPGTLFDAMLRVPPESMRVLTTKELEGFGLSHDDPVAQELDDAEEARHYGLTKQQYLARKARREKLCQPVYLGPNRVREAVDMFQLCRDDVMRGIR